LLRRSQLGYKAQLVRVSVEMARSIISGFAAVEAPGWSAGSAAATFTVATATAIAAALPAAGAQAAVLDKSWIIYPASYRAYPGLDKPDKPTIRGDRTYPVLRLYYPKLACQAGGYPNS
jgi:hypothetical protein